MRSHAGRAAYRLYSNLDHHNAPLAASGMAFDTFLSLVPLVAFAGFVLGILHQRGELVLEPIAEAAPAPVAMLVNKEYLRLTGEGAVAMAPLSLLAFVWVTSSGISTALGVFEVMFETKPRPWAVRRAIGIACVLGSILIVGAVAAASYGVATALGPTIGRVLAVTIPILTLIGILAGFFRIAVRRKNAAKRVAIGVTVTITLWSIVSAMFSYYVATLSRYATLYGNLATVAIFLFWLWLLALALLVGGEVAAQLDGIRRDDAPPSGRIIGPSSLKPRA